MSTSDAHVQSTIIPTMCFQVRKGRSLKTEVVNNNPDPQFDALFRFVIDDPSKQRLRLLVKDSDWLSDTVVGYAEIPIKVRGSLEKSTYPWLCCTQHAYSDRMHNLFHISGCTILQQPSLQVSLQGGLEDCAQEKGQHL